MSVDGCPCDECRAQRNDAAFAALLEWAREGYLKFSQPDGRNGMTLLHFRASILDRIANGDLSASQCAELARAARGIK